MRPSPYSARVTAAAKEKEGGRDEMKSVVCYYMQSNVVKHNCNNRVRGWVTDISMVIMCYPSPFRVKPRLVTQPRVEF